MKQYDNFLFDWDGCLATTLELWLNGYRETFKEFNLSPTDEQIVYHFGNMRGPLEMGVTNLDKYNSRLFTRMQHNLKEVSLYPQAKELLMQLKSSGKNIALISTSPEAVLQQALAHNKLDGVFRVVLSGDAVQKHKPDPEIIFTAMSLMNVPDDLSKTVIIGDSKSDLGAGNNAHIDSILMYPKAHKTFYSLASLKEFKPNYIFASFGEFLEALAK